MKGTKFNSGHRSAGAGSTPVGKWERDIRISGVGIRASQLLIITVSNEEKTLIKCDGPEKEKNRKHKKIRRKSKKARYSVALGHGMKIVRKTKNGYKVLMESRSKHEHIMELVV